MTPLHSNPQVPVSQREAPWRWTQQCIGEQLRSAHRGIKLGIRGHASFFVVFFIAVLVLVAAVVLGCGRIEWCLLLGCIGLVLTAKLAFVALETLCQSLGPPVAAGVRPSVEIAAGALAVAIITAIVVGGAVLLARLAILEHVFGAVCR